MNLLLVRPHEISTATTVCIRGDRSTHLRKVLGLNLGDKVRLGFPDGPQGEGQVSLLAEEVEITHDLDPNDSPASHEESIHIVLAMPRPKVLRRVLSHLAALGVASIQICRSWYVEKSYLQSELVTPDSCREFLLDGLEQARETRVPKLSFHPLFRPFVEDVLPTTVPKTNRLVLHPGSDQTLATSGLKHDDALTLAVGPERGWTDFECELLESVGFARCSMGHRILRVETALTAAVAQARLLTGIG